MHTALSSYKTTILGLIAAIGVVVVPLMQSGTVSWKQIGVAALCAAFGFVAKDANVTGGTTPNKANDPAVVQKTGQ